MKKFLIYITGFLLLVIVLSEVTIRFFDLAGKTMLEKEIDNNAMLKPGEKGFFKRGGLKEINSYYSINKQGYNSIIDYDTLDKQNINIALIGDSYVQGMHTDVRHSIGRQLEELFDRNVIVHEYGRDGANIVDYALTFKKYIQSKPYDFTFILVTDKDLRLKKPSTIGRGDRVFKENIFRSLYDNFHLLRYLNINHGLMVHFNKLINNGPESIDRIHGKNSDKDDLIKETYLNKVNNDALGMISSKVIFLYEEDRLSHYFIESFNFQFKKVIHLKHPINHGLDKHWNINGRYNCAKTMADYINEHKNRTKKINENKNLN